MKVELHLKTQFWSRLFVLVYSIITQMLQKSNTVLRT